MKKISDLENTINIELKEVDEIDFRKKDDKEQKEFLDFYSSCETVSQKSIKKMNEIDKNLNKIVSRIKPLVIRDENEWKNWTGRDFKK